MLWCVLLFLSIGCGNHEDKTKQSESEMEMDVVDENQRLLRWMDDVFERNLSDSPEFLSYLGRKDRQGELDDISDAQIDKEIYLAQEDLEALGSFDTSKLDSQHLISLRLLKRQLERKIEFDRFRYYSYPVNQMHGMQSGMPSFMINMHKIDNKEDAMAYISRLNLFLKKFEQLNVNLKIRADKGNIVPKFVFKHLYNECNSIIGNENDITSNVLFQDFSTKIKAINLTETEKEELLYQAQKAVQESVIVAYKGLKTQLNELEIEAGTDDGVWRFNDGEEFYKYRLEEVTSTTLSGDEIFNTGLAEVKRIHEAMSAIMTKVNYKGSLSDFFKFVKKDAQFYYPDTDEGKEKMLLGYQEIVDTMENHLDEVFFTKPKARMQVKAVEQWREQSAGKAFYQRGTPDGKRKGTFYANLFKMEDMPKYEMEALAYHEGIPGHHMQGSISQEMKDIPMFRKFSRYTAYTEGWGLYCELLPKEMGFYQDPYSDFGRLAMELWRACRLVVDVGIHQNKWPREKAIAYLMENTPNSENSCTKAIERYIVLPGQATAYKVGMLHILKMREKAKNALGDKFDIRKFHDVFLKSGAVPLSIFEENIDAWIIEEM